MERVFEAVGQRLTGSKKPVGEGRCRGLNKKTRALLYVEVVEGPTRVVVPMVGALISHSLEPFWWGDR